VHLILTLSSIMKFTQNPPSHADLKPLIILPGRRRSENIHVLRERVGSAKRNPPFTDDKDAGLRLRLTN
jgi:hypothetical protein